MSSVAYNCPRLLRQCNLVFSVLGGSRIPRTSWDPPFMSLRQMPHVVRRIPRTSQNILGSSLHVPQTKGGSRDVQGILLTVWTPVGNTGLTGSCRMIFSISYLVYSVNYLVC